MGGTLALICLGRVSERRPFRGAAYSFLFSTSRRSSLKAVMKTRYTVGMRLTMLRSGVLCSALALVLGLALGYLWGNAALRSSLAAVTNSLRPIEEKGTSYAFVRPLLAYRTPEANTLGQYNGLKSSLQSLVSTAGGQGVSRAGVYFRDLTAALWVGVNENDTYYPASLLKVPVMIAYKKEAEDHPWILEESMTYNPAVIPSDPYLATSTLVAGRQYSVEEFMRRMIVDSDNGATFTLLNHLDAEYLNSVYTALGIENPDADSASYKISARSYGLFFRILYNATYLSPSASESALKLLARTTFANGLVAGVPPATPLAHKWGEHVLLEGGVMTGIELSDCGIVYYPAHPYLLCVMTSAKDLAHAEAFMKSISVAAYTAVDERYATPAPAR